MGKLLNYAVMAGHAKYNMSILERLYSPRFKVDFYRDYATDTELYTLESKDNLYIIFRGTEIHCIKDYLTDINAFAIPYGNLDTKIRVHNGCYKAYQSVRTFIHEKLYLLFKSLTPKQVTVIGHSLGGGLAPLCAVDIEYCYLHEPSWGGLECYIYGALKCFNKAGVESYNKRVPLTINVQNSRDIVPFMPPVFGYEHVGEIYKIKSKHLTKNHDILYGYIDYLEGK